MLMDDSFYKHPLDTTGQLSPSVRRMLVRKNVSKTVFVCLAQVFEHLGVVGEAAFLVFREDDLVVQGNFEGAAAGGDEFKARYVVFMFVQQLFRQTDGFRKIASRGAVFDAETLFLVHVSPPL